MALDITSGIIDIPQGGTNAGTAPAARVNLLPSLAGNATKVLAVNAGATDVEFIASGAGTVTSVALSAPAMFTVTGSPVSTTGTLTLSYSGTALPIANGGTGATSASSALSALSGSQRATFPTFSENSLRAVDIRNITNPTTGLGYAAGFRARFTSLNDDSSTPYADAIDLSTYADSSGGGFNSLYFGKNSQLIQHKYAAAAGTAWTTKTLAYTDSTITGNAANVTGTVAIANGGTGATTAALARTGLGATTVGSNLFTTANPSAITFIRINADNTVSTLDASTFRTAIGAGTSSTLGTVTSVGGTGTVSGLTLSGTVTSSGNLTLGGTLAVTASNFASQTANTFLAAPNGAAGVPTFRALVAADVPTLNQNTTGSAATLTTARTINGVSFNGSANILVPSIYDSTYRRITNPGGGQYITSTASITGALAIALPTAVYGQSKMVTFRVTVYEYLTGESIEIQVSGYQYSAGNWLNMSGYILAQSNINRNYSIRFAKDTTNLRYVVYIGELATTWDYPQVFVTDVQNGYGSNEAGWESGWSIYFESTAFATVSATISNPQIGYSATTSTANALVLRDGSGNFAANVVTLASIQSTAVVNVLNASAAQGIKVGNLVVSNAYANNAPTNGIYVTGQIQSAVVTGTSPFNIASTTVNTNLNADLLDGLHAASTNTVSTVVARDGSGNFSAGTITATLSGNATNVTGTVAIANGGTGATTAAAARTGLGATTVGSNLFTLTNPSAIRFPRINADNTVSALDATAFRTAIGAGAGSTPTYTEITATAGQTSFSVSYTVGTIDVFLNGIRLNAADYTASNGTTVVLSTPTLAGSVLAVKTFTIPPVITNRESVFYVSSNTSATSTNTYVLLGSYTLTLPASPVEGDYVKVSNRSGTVTCVLGRNGSNIMGLAEDMTLDNLNAGLTLVYTNSTNGWVFV